MEGDRALILLLFFFSLVFSYKVLSLSTGGLWRFSPRNWYFAYTDSLPLALFGLTSPTWESSLGFYVLEAEQSLFSEVVRLSWLHPRKPTGLLCAADPG